MRENHQSNPLRTIITIPTVKPTIDLRGDSVVVTGGVSVGDGVMDGIGEGVTVAGLGVDVSVAGGVRRRSSFWSVRMIEVLLSPFHAIRSASEMSYRLAIHESVSPLWTVW